MIEEWAVKVEADRKKWAEEHPPTVTVTQASRWWYDLVLTDDIMECGRWAGFGSRARVDRKARRKLARYLLQKNRQRESWRVVEP